MQKKILLIIVFSLIALLLSIVLSNFILKKTKTCTPIKFKNKLLAYGNISLDLKNVLVFKSDNNQVGYLYFKTIKDNSAQYIIELFKNDSSFKSICILNKKVSMGKNTQNIRCGTASFIWQYPGYVYIVSGVDCVATVPLSDIEKFKTKNWEFVKWIKLITRDVGGDRTHP